MIYIVGSGAAGVSAASALLKGTTEQVTILDVGNRLEPTRVERIRRMSRLRKDEWAPSDVAAIKANTQPDAGGIPLKYTYGSDYPYRHGDDYLPRDAVDTGLLPSFGRGGLGNVWGASVLPYHRDEFSSWPITEKELAPHYAAVLSFMPLSGAEDELAEQFPLHSAKVRTLTPSRQAQSFLTDLGRHRETLKDKGILFGQSRLAVNGEGCAMCALCMYGCPYEVIYSPAFTLDELCEHPRFRYRPGVVVERFSEESAAVRVQARSHPDGEALIFEGSRLIVAGGVLPSARMVLESMGAYDTTLSILDSQYFLLPLMRYTGAPGISSDPLHTLAQVFIEIFDKQISANSVHLQIYTYNDLYLRAIQAALRFAYPLFRPLSDAFLQRMLLVQGYLHSDLSSRIEISLNSSGTISLHGRRNPATTSALRAVVRKLRENRSLLRAVPFRAAMKVSEPGRGFHAGGTFPMREQPGPFETDTLGRPTGYQRVHLVDASVLPSINASTITLTVMANAHRIGSEVSRLC